MSLIPALLVIFLLIVAAFVILKPQLQIIPEQERVVIFHLGRFRRIGGPGLLLLLTRMETVEDRYNTAHQPRNFWVPNVLIHGIEATLSVNLWMRTDLVAAAAGDRSRLAEIALIKEGARSAQVAVEIKRALNEGLAALTAPDRLPETPTLLDKLAVLLPGSRPCEELLAYLSRELTARLRAFGIILDPQKRISIVQVQLPEDVVQVLSRSRLLDSLNQQLPDLPPNMRAQVAASIEGVQALHIQELVVKSQDGAPNVVRERVPLKDGTLIDLVTDPSAPPKDSPALHPSAASPEPAVSTQQLSKQDLQVLKRVSRDSRVRRKAV